MSASGPFDRPFLGVSDNVCNVDKSSRVKEKTVKTKLTLHDVALDLQFPTHEECLSLGLAGDQFAKVFIRQNQCDYIFAEFVLEYASSRPMFCQVERFERISHTICFLGRLSFADLSTLFQVQVPRLLFILVVCQFKGEDRTTILDGGFSFGVVGQGVADGVKGFRGRESVCGEEEAAQQR